MLQAGYDSARGVYLIYQEVTAFMGARPITSQTAWTSIGKSYVQGKASTWR